MAHPPGLAMKLVPVIVPVIAVIGEPAVITNSRVEFVPPFAVFQVTLVTPAYNEVDRHNTAVAMNKASFFMSRSLDKIGNV